MRGSVGRTARRARLGRGASVVLAGLAVLTSACSGADGEGETTGDGPTVRPSAPTSAPTTPPTRTSTSTALPDGGPRLDRALVDAAWANDVRRARRLIDRGADVNWRDASVQNAFLIATSEGHLRLLELTLDRGAKVHLHDSFDGTGLIRAAERGHWEVVGRLLRTPLRKDVDHVNNLGWTALHEAIVLGQGTPDDVTTVRVLVAGGADLDVPTGTGTTALQEATDRGQDVVVRTLRRGLGAVPDRPDAALLRAAAHGDADGVAVALRAGADLETRDGNGRTALLLASAADHLAAAQVLVALGASPDAVDDRSDTPWLVTGVTGSVPMAELLLRHDPDLTLRNRYGGVSIIPASERGHVDYVRRVSRTGIDVNHINDLGWTALLEAVILGDGSAPYQQIVRILLDAGADPGIADQDGVTALEHARSKGQARVAAILARAD
ncbi:ankyrin repeat domain-containing protein [Nocardioides guangzhouensis]|uniref:ankyrin repeat domain-containing protein n=1 Tax=Nocardioides guangzhouensis TaxID=2497878 RepID=UPI001FE4E01B|nr:ankyrin repeat domain-containing protein [Nocardioides guangzhouensis]